MSETATLPLLLKQLNLTSMARHWPALLEQAEHNAWNGAHYLSALREQELADRHSRRIARYAKESHLPVGKSLASFDFAEAPDLQRGRIEALAGSTDCSSPVSNCASKTPCTSSINTPCSFWTISVMSKKANRRHRCCSS